MHYAIIAAGEGSRLRHEGVPYDKPLVPIHGQPMIDRLIGIMCRCHAESISVICNAAMPDVCQHLEQLKLDIPLHLVVAQTPSSMHSLARLADVIPDGKVCVTTVDTIFPEADFATFIETFERADHPLFVVTPFVEDEKPLWISVTDAVGPTPSIAAFCDERPSVAPYLVSGGIYGLYTSTAWPVLRRCLTQGQSRMRNYQRALLSAGIDIHAWTMDCVLDIDHASDIARAEAWIRSRRALLVRRAAEHSPNNVASDAAILDAVSSYLRGEGCYDVQVIGEETLSTQSLARLTADDVVLHMARRISSLTLLAQVKAQVINDPRSVMPLAGSREYMLSMLHEAGICVPAWWAYDPEDDDMFQCDPSLQGLLPGWVKATRPDGARPDDVMWVDTPLQADSQVLLLASQHVPDIVVTRHVEGDLLKVYCVAGDIISTFYPQESGYSKFGGQEQHNTALAHHPYDPEELSQVARTIATALRLQVFGFDAIISHQGLITVIDVNDWPSFSPCRPVAAQAIASMIHHKLSPHDPC